MQIDSAYFIQKTNSNDKEFYTNLFLDLKKEIDFSYCALFFKKGRENIPVFELGEISKYKLKIPFKTGGSAIGYILLSKKTPYLKKEKDKANTLKGTICNKIKDFEISKIFQNQLLILQEAIIEKNKTAKKLEEQNEKLVKTDKVRSEFLANVSHELRTPLNSIIGFSSALKDELIGSLNEKQKNYTNKILSSAIHLTGLINDILDMTKIEAGAMKLNLVLIKPNDVIKEVINIIEPLASEKNVKIETDFKFEGEIFADYVKFRQIIYNLAGNAIKFSHKNSKIILKTNSKKNSAVIKIKDFGVGIDKKNQKRIFEKFVQLDNIYTKTTSSTGLGLTITEEFVKLHGGKIKLNSKPDIGSEFTVEFKKACN